MPPPRQIASEENKLGNAHFVGLAISRAARAAVSVRGSAETNGGSRPHQSPAILYISRAQPSRPASSLNQYEYGYARRDVTTVVC